MSKRDVQITLSKSLYENQRHEFNSLVEEYSKLKEENRKLREMGKFYADKSNWKCSDLKPTYHESFLEIKLDGEIFGRETVGGKLARQTLKELGGSDGWFC